MKKLLLIPIALLAGCASTEYAQYTTTQQAIAASRAQSDTARYQALAQIAAKGDATASVAAAMALAMGGQSAQQQVAPPQPNQALQWASVLVPAVTQAYAIGKNAEVAIASSNNAALTSASTTAAFVGIAGKIQAPVVNTPVVAAPVLPQANVTTDSHDSTLSGTGTLGSGAYSTTDSHNTTTPAPVITPVVQIVPTVVPQTITPTIVPPVEITPVIQVVPIATPGL